jgi:hypothetical protein
MGKSTTKGKSKPAAKKGKPKNTPFQKVGVIQTIVDTLKKASSKNPVTKDDVLEILKTKFPERDERAMKSTVSSQIPSGLRVEKGLEVEKNDKGYWLPKDAVASGPKKKADVKPAKKTGKSKAKEEIEEDPQDDVLDEQDDGDGCED